MLVLCFVFIASAASLCTDQWRGWTNANFGEMAIGECSTTCGTGFSVQLRSCNGTECQGASVKTTPCYPGECQESGNKCEATWGLWQNWEACSVTCGSGNQLSRRTCIKDMEPCLSGEPTRTRECQTGTPCIGTWTEWRQTVACPVTCGTGMMSFERTCNTTWCVGDATEQRECATNKCPVDGNWGDWGEIECGVTCGEGTGTRSRTCSNPAPSCGGHDCVGSATLSVNCTKPHCPIDGGWNPRFDSHTPCSVTCGPGIEIYYHKCNNPVPQYGGQPCGDPGPSTTFCEIAWNGTTYEDVCPCTRHSNCGTANPGSWSVWEKSGCSKTCGMGTINAKSTCSEDINSEGAKSCKQLDTIQDYDYPHDLKNFTLNHEVENDHLVRKYTFNCQRAKYCPRQSPTKLEIRLD